MKIKYEIKNVEGLVLPSRANENDAGYDVIATSDPKIVGVESSTGLGFYNSIDYIEYETGIYIHPCEKFDNRKFWGEFFGSGRVMCEKDRQELLDKTLLAKFHTDMRPRSSVSKYNLVLANSIGLIDAGYQDQVKARFKYIVQPEDLVVDNGRVVCRVNVNKIYKKGDKIAQLVPMVTHDINFEKMDKLTSVNRGGGFGSTGK